MVQAETQYEIVQGNLSVEVKNEIEILFQRRDLQGNHRPLIISFQQKDHIHRIRWLINKRLQISEIQFDKFPHTFNLFMLEDKIQNPSECLLRFSLGSNVMDQRSGVGRFLEEFRSSRSIEGKDFPNFEVLDARIVSALNMIIKNSHFKKKVSLKAQKAQKEDRFFRGRQIAYMIYDYFRVTGAHNTVLDYAEKIHNYSSQRCCSGVRYEMG